MRNVIFQMMISLDGFFEGPRREIDWHIVDEEFNAYASDLLNSVDLLVFGRVTYELMASYWPTQTAQKDDPIIAEQMNALPKVVFSNTLRTAGWAHTRLVSANPADELKRAKQEPGKDIAVFGSSDLAVTLIGAGLIDEFRIFVNPVILGEGKPLLQGITGRLRLRLLSVRRFASGNVLLCYAPGP